MTREDVVNRLKEVENDFESYMGTLDGEALTNAGTFIASLRAKLADIPEGIPDGEVVAKEQYDKVKDAYKAIIMGREPVDIPEDTASAPDTVETNDEEVDAQQFEDLIYDNEE